MNLKEKKIWVNWKYEERDGKKTKVPYNPRTGGKAQSNNPDTWTDFNFAKSKADDYSGIGFMFADGICGIDIDNKTDNPELDKQAEAIINLMDTYTERSPSGTGYHIIFKCDMSKIPTIDKKLNEKYYLKNPNNDLECYFAGLTNRYFTYTGEIINDKNIEDRTEQILIFLENYMLKDNFKKKSEPSKREQSEKYLPNVNILEKARKAKNGLKFSALYDRGDVSAHNNDDSSADLALCSMLAWWLQGDFNNIDYYFRSSALYREKWERNDYRTTTIKRAIDSCGGEYYKPPGRPKKEKAKKEYTPEQEELIKNAQNRFGVMDDEKLTIAGVAFHLEQNGISVKYNETVREAEIKGLEKYNNNYIVDNFPVIMYNDLNLQYKKCNISIVQDFLRVIMMNNAYNPVRELIESSKWDGTDRLQELFRIMRIDDNDELSKTLVYKWLWQNLSMARNEKGEYGADGILVLKGGQAAGKTTFARKMALKNEWFGEGLLLDVRQTDTVIRAVSCWVGELGEIESTFKSDINALKAFITLPKDNYRVPYGRIADKLPRRTSFIGTCNSDQYLIDETGNRRYWTVPINERMDLEALEKFDMLQLYLQVDEKAKNNIQGFRLTPEELTQLAERNSTHEKLIKGEQEVKDILYKAEKDNITSEEMTVTEFKELYPVLRNYSGEQIGKVLKKLGIITEIKKKNGKTQKLAVLPRPKYHKLE
jgi:hypothetical protein